MIAAISSLGEMGLPFKKLNDNKLSEMPSSKSSAHAGGDPGRARPDDEDNRQSYDGHLSNLVGEFQGFDITAPTKPQQTAQGNPWLSAEYDVFAGRSVSGGPSGPRSTMSVEAPDKAEMEQPRDSGSGIKSKSPQNLEPHGEQNRFRDIQSVDDYKVPPPTPSNTLAAAFRSISDEYPAIARYLERHGKHPTEKGANVLAPKSNTEWNVRDRPGSPAQTKEKYLVPQRRMSDITGRPKLRLDTMPGTTARSTEEADAPLASVIASDRLTGAFPPSNFSAVNTDQIWGTYSGEQQGFGDRIISDNAMLHILAQEGGYHSTGISGVGGGTAEATSDDRFGQNFTYALVPTENPVEAGPSAAASAFPIRFLPSSPESSVHPRQPGYLYSLNDQAVPGYLKENRHPRFEPAMGTEQVCRGYRNGGYSTQSPTRFPRPGYQGIARPPAPRVPPVETTSVYTMQPQAAPAEAYMKDFNADGFYSYYLKAIPLTGPRFIR